MLQKHFLQGQIDQPISMMAKFFLKGPVNEKPAGVPPAGEFLPGDHFSIYIVMNYQIFTFVFG